MKKYKSGLLPDQRQVIREALVHFTREHASLLGCPSEAVVQEIRYWQQSNTNWRTNPSRKHKESSFQYHGGICAECHKEISSMDDATFHHWERGIPDLNGPKNMVPLHRNKAFGCHEKIHKAPPGSFTAGSMSKKQK
jgi:hypothetical protein